MSIQKSVITSEGWIDVSAPIKTGMAHWPDNPPIEVSSVFSMDKGDVCNLSKISMGLHTGTHVDAPLHFVKGAAPMSTMPWDAMIGPVRVIPIKDKEAITRVELEDKDIGAGERILFRTSNSDMRWPLDDFKKDFVYISEGAAEYLAEKKARTVWVDYLSVGGYAHDCVETHEAILGSGLWIIEGLDLSKIKPGNYEMLCLPLRLDLYEAAPARVLLRPI